MFEAVGREGGRGGGRARDRQGERGEEERGGVRVPERGTGASPSKQERRRKS